MINKTPSQILRIAEHISIRENWQRYDDSSRYPSPEKVTKIRRYNGYVPVPRQACDAVDLTWVASRAFGLEDPTIAAHHTLEPRTFFIEMTDDNFEMATSLDKWETIWAQGEILRYFEDSEISETHTKKNLKQTTLLEILRYGFEAIDHHGRVWRYAYLENEDALQLSHDLRVTFQYSFGLDNFTSMAFPLNETHCLIAMEEDSLQHTIKAYKASLTMLALQMQPNPDPKKERKLLRQGASYRYIDPARALQGFSFSNCDLDSPIPKCD